MNQHDFVRGCLEFYEEAGITPEKGWEEAHYPAPKGQGTETIWLTHDHHQIQGLLQSEEYSRMCFWGGKTKKFLTEGSFVPGWFELWDIYDEWISANAKNMGTHPNTDRARPENGKNMASHPNSQAARVENGKRNVRTMIDHPNSQAARIENGKKHGKRNLENAQNQKWMSTDPNHPPKISTAGPLARWQRARGIDTKLRIKLQ